MRAGETTAVSPSPFRHSSVVRKVLNESACAVSSGMGLSVLTSGPCELVATWGCKGADTAVTDPGDGVILLFHRAEPSAPWNTSEISCLGGFY